jgi:hypothetical protein
MPPMPNELAAILDHLPLRPQRNEVMCECYWPAANRCRQRSGDLASRRVVSLVGLQRSTAQAANQGVVGR